MKKILLIAILFSVFFNAESQAQNDTTKLKGMIYSFVPQYLINHGIRLDIEKQITPRSFIQFCPQFYLGEQKDNSSNGNYYNDISYEEDDYDNVIGGGINIYHKIFANKNFLDNGVYFSYGFSYSYFEIDYLEEYLDNTINTTGTIQKMGGDLLIGYQFFLKNKLSIDLYTGIGTRFSELDNNTGNTNRFNDNYFSYNYSGNLLHIGFRVGLIL
jgi:hypothetical protein